MMKKRLSKTIWYGSDVDPEGNPVVPELAEGADDLEGLHHGELYLHEADDNLSLWARTLTNQVKPIGGLGGGGSLWKLMETESGEKYLFTEFNVVTQMGITSFADNKILDLPDIYDGLPIDNQTLYWEEVKEEVGTDEEGNPIYQTTRVLKSKGGGSSSGGGGVAESVHWDNIEGKPDFSQYVTSDVLGDYLPLSGGTMKGVIRMGNYSIDFGSTGYISGGQSMYIRDVKGIAISTGYEAPLLLAVSEVNLYGGVFRYNPSGKYFEFDGNLVVTGGITSFADGGAGNQWIMDAESLEEVTSDNEFKVYSAKVTSMIAASISGSASNAANAINKLASIKIALSSISSTSTVSAIGSALRTIYNNI